MRRSEAGASWGEAGHLPDSSSFVNRLSVFTAFRGRVRAEWTDCKMDALCSTCASILVCLKSWQGCYFRTCSAQLAAGCR